MSQLYTYERLLGTLLLLAIGLASALTPMQTDTWWQLRAGHDMWSSWHVLSTDTYSHTAYGAFWPNHEWLAEIIYYGAYRIGGLPLVTLFATALIAAAWFVTWHLTGGPVRLRFVLIALALVPASMDWEPRPHAFSFLFLTVTVYLLIERRLAWLPLLFLIWANCHGGVLLGFVVLVAGLGAAILEAPRTWWQTAALVLACAAAATLTPLGIFFWSEIPKSLARIHRYPIDEWQSAALTDVRLLPFWVIATALCVAVVRFRATLRTNTRAGGTTLCACAFALLPMAISAVRNVGPFLMVAVPAVSVLIAPLARAQATAKRPERPRLNLAILSAAATAVALLVAWAYASQINRLRWTPLPPASLAALQRCPDNLYNRYDEGGYLIWFAPYRRVFLDGRQDPYEPGLVREQIRIESTGDYRAAFARYGIHCVYLPTSSPVVGELSASAWTTLYRDSNWIVLAGR